LKPIATWPLLFLLAFASSQAHALRAVSFNLSTNRTFSPDEKPTIHLYAHDVDELEFRIYRVNDPEKFLTSLPDLHSFDNGNSWPGGPKEQIDEKTWLERFHDWKRHIWYLVRHFFRSQFSMESRDFLRIKQANLAKRSRIVGVAQFAQIPLLNDHQLVARWRQEMPPTYISDSQELPIDPLPSGIYLVEATDGHYKAYTILMVSRMVLITRTTAGTILTYAVDRQTGAPIPHAQVKFGFGNQERASAETDADGIAELHGPVTKQEQDNLWVLAMAKQEFAAVTPMAWAFNNSGGSKWASYVYTDRPVYRPGHTVHWKALLRARVENHLALPKLTSIHIRIADEQDHPAFEKDLPVSADGAIAGDLTLDAHAPLGYYTIRLGDPGDGVNGSFHVEEYRKPEYQVRVAAQSQRVLQGQSMQVVIDSRYFFGEPVAFGKVKYRIYHSPHYWWDGDQDDNQGGDQIGNDAGEEQDSQTDVSGADEQSEQTAKLDANGKLTVTIPTRLDSTPHHYDQDYVVEAAVTDEANREITGRGHFLATYGSYRIQVEPESYAVRIGQNAAFKITAVDYDGKPVQARVHVGLSWHRWAKGNTTITQGASTDVTTDERGQAHASLLVDQSGSAQVDVSSNTPENRTVVASTWLWVLGGNDADWFAGGSRSVQIIADKKTYAPGDTAHLSIVSEVGNFHALVVAAGNTIEFRKVIASDGTTVNFDLPITTDSQPNLEVSAVFLENGQLYQASQQIKVPPLQQQLRVEITRNKQVFQPEQPAEYDVYTRDYQGKPISADLSFGVVDEAIYSIYPDSSGDIVKNLYPNRFNFASVDSSLQYYFSGAAGLKSPMLAERSSRYRPQLAQVKPGNDMVQPKVRKAFPDTAYWAPSIHTDVQGHAHVKFTFPDSLTTWRTTVRAITADSRAGSAIDRVIVRKNVIVRMGTPRFLRKGDEITIPVIAHNYLDQPKQIQLSLEIQGLDLVAGTPQQISVPSKGDGTALWRVKASSIGEAKLLAKALTNEESDALEITFPIEPSGVRQNISRTGVISAAAPSTSININFPTDTDASAHGLQIEVSPSIAGSLFSSLDYLTSYPYGCTEQTMSSFLPNVIVAETLKKLNVPAHINLDDLKTKVDAGFDRLADYQHDDGGWGWWKEDDSRVFMTAYVVSGLAEAARSYPLNWQRQQMLEKGKNYLQTQLSQHPRMLPDLRAYVVYALAESGSTDASQLDTLWSRRDALSPEGLALTGLAMLHTANAHVPEMATLLESKARQEGELVSWPSNRSPVLDLEYDNSAESTAFAMRFLSRADAHSPLLPKAAQWLMLNRDGGYWWDSTEQTAMVIFGLTDYLSSSQELNADFDVEVRVNGSSLGKRHFTPADAITGATLSLSSQAAKLQPNNTIEIVRSGSGQVYWTTQGTYYSTEHKLYQKGTLSLNLTRDYFRLVPTQEKDKIVYRLDPLKGPVQPGDTLAVHIAINGSQAKYLFLEDPIPAGTEFVQHEDSYGITGLPSDWTYWYTRREFHDDRAVIFAAEFDGHQESYYLLKVVNPGNFSISPALVEPMYQPDVQATSDELHLLVNAETKP
jgi:alpha-2-macroglobulin